MSREERTNRYDRPQGKHHSPVFLFFCTLVIILGCGGAFLFSVLAFSGRTQEAGNTASSGVPFISVTEEAIPGTEDGNAENGGSGQEPGDSPNASGEEGSSGDTGSLPGVSDESATGASGSNIPDAESSPTASENIVKTSAGTYALTSTQQSDRITFAFAGDILFDTRYAAAASIVQRGGNAENSFDAETLSTMRSADVFMVNNEFPYSNRGTPLAGKKYTFRADPANAEWLAEMGADIVSLANNHCFDYGEEALLDTLDTLDAMGMIHVGAGHNLDEASEPAIFEYGGMKIAILNATMIEQGDNPETRGATDTQSGVFRCWDWTNLVNKIKEVDSEVDETIVYIHWGTEKRTDADWSQTQCAAALEEAGADFIIGDHPHVLEPFASDGHTFVIYSLGNFLFTSFTADTGILEVTFTPSTKSVSDIRFIPMLQTDCSVQTLSGSEKTRVLDFMRTGSSGVNVDEDGNITISR